LTNNQPIDGDSSDRPAVITASAGGVGVRVVVVVGGGGGGGGVSAAPGRCGGDGGRVLGAGPSTDSGIPLACPAVLRRAAAPAAAAAAGGEQLLEPGAKLVAEEAVDERIDAAVGRARPLRHRDYRLSRQSSSSSSSSLFV